MVSIDYQSKLPFYEQIAQHFQTLILRGALPPGSQMPSVRSLAVDLSINPNTIQKAYSLLEQEGYIFPVKAESSGLAAQKKKAVLDEFTRLLHSGKELGITKQECVLAVEDAYRKGDSYD